MARHNPRIHHRRSIRLKGYDYSKAGMYFITICVKNRKCLFGDIKNGKLTLNDAGQMIEEWYRELENKFPDIKYHEMTVMPNHFHCIIENTGSPAESGHQRTARADPRASPESQDDIPSTVRADLRVSPTTSLDVSPATSPENPGRHDESHDLGIQGEHAGSPLGRVVQWFKTMTTNEYIRGVKNKNWEPFDGKLWQRNYWERIIRNEKAYHNITEYIKNNPSKWPGDKLFNA